jgi:hypothetical protein
MMFLPLLYAFIVFGKTYSSRPFRQVYILLALISVNDFCQIVYDSVYACIPKFSETEQKWFGLIHIGVDL